MMSNQEKDDSNEEQDERQPSRNQKGSSDESSSSSFQPGPSRSGNDDESESDDESASGDEPPSPSRRHSSRFSSLVKSGRSFDDSDSSDEDEESTTEHDRLTPRGIGLRTKLIFLVLIAQIFSAAFVFFMSISQTREALENEIDKNGILLVRILSRLQPAFLKEVQGTEGKPSDKLKRTFRKQNVIFQKIKSFIQDAAGQEAVDRFSERYDNLKNNIDNEIDSAFQSLVRSGKSDRADFMRSVISSESIIESIDFRYRNQEGKYVRSIYRIPMETLKIERDRPTLKTVESGGNSIRISETFLNDRPVRVYEISRPLPDSENNYTFEVMLALSARAAEQAAGKMTYTLLIVTLLSVLCGGVAGWFFSGHIIKPINSLLEDIDTVSKGNLDHKTVPESTDEIGVMARTFNRMTKSLKEAQERELETKAMEHELNIAMEVQGELLPDENPELPGWDVATFYRPSKEVGGDYYDFIRIDEDHLAMVVADVSGKGIPGSLIMTMTRAMIRMEATRNLSTKETLIRTNRMLAKDIREGMFVTCMYAILDIPESRLRVSSAGHNPMIVWRQKQKQVRTVNPNGIALGFDEGPLFERTIVENVIELEKGDRFVIYTDGIVESMNPEEEEFGEERFFKLTGKLAQKGSQEFTDGVTRILEKHQGEAEQHDDITILTARRIE